MRGVRVWELGEVGRLRGGERVRGPNGRLAVVLLPLRPNSTSRFGSYSARRCSMPPAAKKSVAASSDALWSRNLRTALYADSDSDNESPGQPAGANEIDEPVISEDARILQALDLSSRQDEAVYKPNPWTIAKVNAATRVPTKAPDPPRPAPKKLPQGRIVDGFRKQAQGRRSAQADVRIKPSINPTWVPPQPAISVVKLAHIPNQNHTSIPPPTPGAPITLLEPPYKLTPTPAFNSSRKRLPNSSPTAFVASDAISDPLACLDSPPATHQLTQSGGGPGDAKTTNYLPQRLILTNVHSNNTFSNCINGSRSPSSSLCSPKSSPGASLALDNIVPSNDMCIPLTSLT